MISGHVSIMHGITGPNIAVVTRVHDLHALHRARGAPDPVRRCRRDARGRRRVRDDAARRSAGSARRGRCLRATTTRQRASRPWDRDRDGFVLSDGAGCVALEEYEHAKARGARIYAELIGFGMSGDAYHITAPRGGRRKARARCMAERAARRGLDAGGRRLHQCARHFDAARRHRRDRRDQAQRSARTPTKLAVSSTKSTTGHMLGAAGAVEAIFSVLAISEQVIPPTINLENPDPAVRPRLHAEHGARRRSS